MEQLPENRPESIAWQGLLENLMQAYGDRVLHLAYSFLRDREEAEDAAQEVFLKVFTGLPRFRGESGYYTWIYRITVNVCRDYLRRGARTEVTAAGPVEEVPAAASTEDSVLSRLEQEQVWQAVQKLPLAYREVVTMHYFAGLAVHEVAAVTGSSVAAVKVRLFRARQKLARLLG